MRANEFLCEGQEWENTDSPMGKLLHNINVEASMIAATGRGPRDSWIPTAKLMKPDWQLHKVYGGLDGFHTLIAQLEAFNKIEYDSDQEAVKLNSEDAAAKDKSDAQMAKYVAKDPNFTRGT